MTTNQERKKKYNDSHREENRIRRKKWYERNKDRRKKQTRDYAELNREHRREQRLLKRYGLPLGSYDKMLAVQGGECAICGSTDPRTKNKRFHVDHDHTTNSVRALLCAPCNQLLGLCGERAAVLSKAISYLGEHSAIQR